jgi:hypothetical protein
MGRGHPQTGPAPPEAARALRELAVSRPCRPHCPQGWDGEVRRRRGVQGRAGGSASMAGVESRKAATVEPRGPNSTPGSRSRCIRVFSVPEQRFRRARARRSSNLAPERGSCTSNGRRNDVERTSRGRRRPSNHPAYTPAPRDGSKGMSPSTSKRLEGSRSARRTLPPPMSCDETANGAWPPLRKRRSTFRTGRVRRSLATEGTGERRPHAPELLRSAPKPALKTLSRPRR